MTQQSVPPPGAPARPGPGSPARRLSGAARVGQAIGVSTVCLLLGWTAFAVTYEPLFERTPSSDFVVLWMFGDFLTGTVLALACGPLRNQRWANLAMVAVFPWSACSIGAGVVALKRLAEERRTGQDLALAGYAAIGFTVVEKWILPRLGLPAVDFWVGLLATILVLALIVLYGRFRGTRGALVESLRAQADAAEHEKQSVLREQEAILTRVRADERTAIAREMHDSLSHHLSVLSMTAGALEHRTDLTVQQTREAAQVIRNAAGVANAELRDVLMALRTGGVGDAGPIASEVAIEDLVQQARSGGAEVHLEWVGLTPDDLDSGPRTAAFAVRRIVAELLANLAKHAPEEPGWLRIELSADESPPMLRIGCRNRATGRDPAALSTGLGLVGVTERARLLGGDSRSGPVTIDGKPGFEVEAWFGWKP